MPAMRRHPLPLACLPAVTGRRLRQAACAAWLLACVGGALASGPPLPGAGGLPAPTAEAAAAAAAAVPAPSASAPPAGVRAPTAAATPSGEVLRADGLALRWEPLEPQRSTASPARLQGALEAPIGRVHSTLRVDPAAPTRAARMDTRIEAGPGAPLPRLVLGDTIGSGAAWSAPAPLGGLRFGRAAAPRAPGAGLAPLAAGQQDWEVEAGRLRSEPAPGDLRYGEPYAGAAWRVGLAPGLTAQARSEWAGQRQAGGVELAQAAGFAGTLQASWAQSATPGAEDASRWSLGLVRSGTGLGWQLGIDGAGRGWTPAVGETGRRAGARIGTRMPLGPTTRVDVDLQKIERWDQPQADTQLAVATRFTLARRSTLVLDVGQRSGAQPGWRAGVALQLGL